jgi:uncharacterized protein
MSRATFRFFAELNDFLPREFRQRDLEHPFNEPVTIKDRIEAFGVPHTDVEFIQINGAPVDFACRLRDGDRVSVYPFMAVMDNPRPLRPPYPRGRFILDQHLGRLAAYLRLMGQDVLHRSQWDDEELARVAGQDSRVLLSRDKGLLMRSNVLHGGFVHATNPRAQVPEVLHRFGARETFAPFTRCLACNGVVRPVLKDAVAARLLPDTRQFYDRFWQCPDCERIYWEGSHVRRMQTWVQAWLSDPDIAPRG